jgi:hypothetical protein
MFCEPSCHDGKYILMMKTEIVLETFVYALFNHLTWLLIQAVLLNSVATKA